MPLLFISATCPENQMKSHLFPKFASCLALSLSASLPCPAQQTPAQIKRLQQYIESIQKIPAAQRDHLSTAAMNLLHYAQSAQRSHPESAANPSATPLATHQSIAEIAATRAATASTAPVVLSQAVVPVNNAKWDFTLSLLGGFTQSESSTAWCGNNVVVGYNDSGSRVRTALLDPQAASSYDGVAVSSNAGRTFQPLDYLNPGTDPAGFLAGSPVVACSTASNFFYASLFVTNGIDGNPTSEVTVSTSTNGGLAWSGPRSAISKSAYGHSLDKEWMALDPLHPNYIYVTYTDNDYSFAGLACPYDSRSAIELVASSNAGSTWSAPVVITEQCGVSGNYVQGSQVAVDRTGTVFVVYELFAADGSRTIELSPSSNHADSFAAPTQVATVTPTGDGTVLEGTFHTNEYPSFAIDPVSSALYIAWADGRDRIVPDLESPTGTYAYSDILLSRSADGGHTWSPATAVSPTPDTYAGTGRDQFMPALAVDSAANVAVCYYDRRNDPGNIMVDRYCSVSGNAGRSWTEYRKTTAPWEPMHGADFETASDYLGDYDTTASDHTGLNPGFIGAFQIQTKGNPDVYAAHF